MTSNATWTPQDLYFQTLRTLPREHGYEPLHVEGALPDDLQGSLYRAGPAVFESFGKPYLHPFEADGGVTSVRLRGREAEGASRVVQSAGLLEEKQAGKTLYGSNASWFSRVHKSFTQQQKNTANTSVMHWQGRIFALMEGAGPTEMHPDTLDTLGATNLDGLIPGAFSAHPHKDVGRGVLYNFGLRYGKETLVDLFAFPDDGEAQRLTTFAIPYQTMVHDFALAGRYAVFTVSPAKLVLWRALFQVGSFADFFRWDASDAAHIFVVDLDNPTLSPVRIETDAHWVWHFGNSFVDGSDIVLDACWYPNLDSLSAIGGADDVTPATLQRGRIDLQQKRLQYELVVDGSSEFPVTNDRTKCAPHQHTWVLRDGGPARVDHATGHIDAHPLPSSQIASEPIFVAKADSTDEVDGYVLSLTYDAATDRSFLLVLDAARMSDEPLARVWFDHPVPLTFHGTWVDGA